MVFFTTSLKVKFASLVIPIDFEFHTAHILFRFLLIFSFLLLSPRRLSVLCVLRRRRAGRRERLASRADAPPVGVRKCRQKGAGRGVGAPPRGIYIMESSAPVLFQFPLSK